MARITVSLNLSKDSQKFLRRFPEKFKKRFYKGLKLAMLHAEAKSKASFGASPSLPGRPPGVITGHLRRSIQSDVDVKGDDLIGVLFSNVIYSRALELGNPIRGLLPRPYLEPALKDNITSLEDIIEKEILKCQAD